MYTPVQLLKCASILNEASLWQRLLGRDYKEATKIYNRLSLKKKKGPAW